MEREVTSRRHAINARVRDVAHKVARNVTRVAEHGRHPLRTAVGAVSVAEPTERSYERLTHEHLARLSDIAQIDRNRFYANQPTYRGRYLGSVLAQGAAQHWVDGVHGVKDLDVWSFFALPPGETRFPADRRKSQMDFGCSDLGRQDYPAATTPYERARFARWSRYSGRRVDLMLRGLRCTVDADATTDPVDRADNHRDALRGGNADSENRVETHLAGIDACTPAVDRQP
jgi:hypothetical protein